MHSDFSFSQACWRGRFSQKLSRFPTRNACADAENKWFALTGRVVVLKVETDGDIHIALQDATGDKPGIVVVEIPEKPQWCSIRQTVFSWTRTRFPLHIRSATTRSYAECSTRDTDAVGKRCAAKARTMKSVLSMSLLPLFSAALARCPARCMIGVSLFDLNVLNLPSCPSDSIRAASNQKKSFAGSWRGSWLTMRRGLKRAIRICRTALLTGSPTTGDRSLPLPKSRAVTGRSALLSRLPR